jgi:hypothetical protein
LYTVELVQQTPFIGTKGEYAGELEETELMAVPFPLSLAFFLYKKLLSFEFLYIIYCQSGEYEE